MSSKHGEGHSEKQQRGEELQAGGSARATKQTHAHVIQRGARQRASQPVHRGQRLLNGYIMTLLSKGNSLEGSQLLYCVSSYLSDLCTCCILELKL